MTTPLIILAILITPTLISAILGHFTQKPQFWKTGAVFGMAFAFIFFGIGHFVATDGMVLMLPDWLPLRHFLVWGTGILEFVIAALVIYPSTRLLGGYLALAVFVLFFPANIYAAYMAVDFGGHAWGLSYLLIRAPLQVILIAWAWYFIVRGAKPARRSMI